MKISKRSRELYDELSRGFNTWDVQSVTAHVLLPERLRVNIGFIVPHKNQYTTNNLWDRVENFGEHSIDGSYTDIYMRCFGGVYRVESSAENDGLVLRVTPVTKRPNMYLSVEVGELFGQTFAFSYQDGTVIAEKSGKKFVIRSLTAPAQPDWDPVTCPHLLASADETCYFTVNSDKNAAEIDAMIERKKNEWLRTAFSAEGQFGEGIAAMRRSLLWNMVYDFVNERVVTPVSRNWCRRGNTGFGDYVLFDWDTFFAGLQYGLIDKRLAYSTTFSILEEITDEGMIPNFGSGVGPSRDRSEPQVGAMCVWKLYVQYGDKWFLEECFDRLLRWNRWRFENRDFNHDGLLELASISDNYKNKDEIWASNCSGDKQGAMFESGLDNSTMWDNAVFNQDLHCMELSYAGLNALMVADCEFLEKIAAVLGRTAEEEEVRSRRLSLTQRIEDELWNEDKECYMNKHWSGDFDPCMSMTHFYAATAGLGKDGRTKRMLEKHLLNPDEFWGEYMIPNISRDDPSFEDQDYWRGRIWAPTNFLVNEGILRCGEHEIWTQLIKNGYRLFMKCWNEHGVVGENYNAITGEAAEKGKSSDRFYHWGALLLYMAVQRVVNFNEWTDAVEYEDRPDWLERIHNLPVGDKKIDI